MEKFKPTFMGDECFLHRMSFSIKGIELCIFLQRTGTIRQK
jgi:hypothetical protein